MTQTKENETDWFYTEIPPMNAKDFQLLVELIGFDNFEWIYYQRDKKTDNHQASIRINDIGTKRLENYVEAYAKAVASQ